MTNLELVLDMLAEVSTKELSEKKDPKTFTESKEIAKKGGSVAKIAKDKLESQLGEEVVTDKNAEEIHFKDKKRLKEMSKMGIERVEECFNWENAVKQMVDVYSRFI